MEDSQCTMGDPPPYRSAWCVGLHFRPPAIGPVTCHELPSSSFAGLVWGAQEPTALQMGGVCVCAGLLCPLAFTLHLCTLLSTNLPPIRVDEGSRPKRNFCISPTCGGSVEISRLYARRAQSGRGTNATLPNSTSNECFLVVDLDAKIALWYLQGALWFLMTMTCFSQLCEVDQYYEKA